jgi:hypothetical protein
MGFRDLCTAEPARTGVRPFALAVASGMTWGQALAVASADQAVDENVFTRPTLQFGVGAPTKLIIRRPFRIGRRPACHDTPSVSLQNVFVCRDFGLNLPTVLVSIKEIRTT